MSTLKICGRLRLYVDGHEVADHRNMVVDDGLTSITLAAMGDPDKVLAYFKAGGGNTPPTASDTALETATFGPKAITSVVYPSPGAIKISFDIVPGEATGETFREFGLFTIDDTMVARWVDGNDYIKTIGNTIQGVWDLVITI